MTARTDRPRNTKRPYRHRGSVDYAWTHVIKVEKPNPFGIPVGTELQARRIAKYSSDDYRTDRIHGHKAPWPHDYQADWEASDPNLEHCYHFTPAEVTVVREIDWQGAV